MFDNAMNIDRNDLPREQTSRPYPAENGQGLALAMTYVPMQCLKNLYAPEKALLAGVLFPELDKPFLGAKGGCNDVR